MFCPSHPLSNIPTVTLLGVPNMAASGQQSSVRVPERSKSPPGFLLCCSQSPSVDVSIAVKIGHDILHCHKTLHLIHYSSIILSVVTSSEVWKASLNDHK
jgi:hypothetical protein